MRSTEGICRSTLDFLRDRRFIFLRVNGLLLGGCMGKRARMPPLDETYTRQIIKGVRQGFCDSVGLIASYFGSACVIFSAAPALQQEI
jgi:hypothetical protein